MRVPDRCLADLRERGYLLFEGFLEADELAAAREALWLHYPRPEVYSPTQLLMRGWRRTSGPAKSADRGDPGT